MQRIGWIDHGLACWAEWVAGGAMGNGRYCSPAFDPQRVAQTDDVRRGLGAPDPGVDAASLEMDRAIASLPPELKRAVIAAYTWDGNLETISQKLSITRATLHRRLCHADLRIDEWFVQRRHVSPAQCVTS